MPGTPVSQTLSGSNGPESALSEFARQADSALEQLARVATGAPPTPGELEALISALERIRFPAPSRSDREQWVYAQLTRATMELSALVLAVQPAASPESVSSN
jgi:hypothetical protein